MQAQAFQAFVNTMRKDYALDSWPKWWPAEMLRTYLFLVAHFDRRPDKVPTELREDFKATLKLAPVMCEEFVKASVAAKSRMMRVRTPLRYLLCTDVPPEAADVVVVYKAVCAVSRTGSCAALRSRHVLRARAACFAGELTICHLPCRMHAYRVPNLPQRLQGWFVPAEAAVQMEQCLVQQIKLEARAASQDEKKKKKGTVGEAACALLQLPGFEEDTLKALDKGHKIRSLEVRRAAC